MSHNNTNLALEQQGVGGLSGIVTGSRHGIEVFHGWQGIWDVLEGAHNYEFVGFGDDFIGKAINGLWQPTVTNAGTVAINAQAGGAIRLSTDTGAADSASQALGLHWLVSNGPTVMRVRVKQVTGITNRIVEVGFGDTIAPAGGLAFSDPSVPTAVDTDAAVFGYKDGSQTTYYAVSVNTGGTPQRVITGALPTPSLVYQDFTVVIDAAGNAFFYVGRGANLAQVASIPLAVAPTATLTPWAAIKNTSAAAHALDIDYMAIHAPRAA